MEHSIEHLRLAVIGLGYVGLPLAVEFGKKRSVFGFDIDEKRITDLQTGVDCTLEIRPEQIFEAKHLNFTSRIEEIRGCNCFIITVPTPIDQNNQPDISLLRKASRAVGEILNIGDIVIYESTVYPGATEEDCVPILEQYSGLTFNQDFYCGYSPERINPGDKARCITDIKKVTSGSTPEIASVIDALYKQVITAGTHKASSIRIAEAAKIIENTQRDLNIALINELAIIFNKMNINTQEVLEAAETKWNFLPFRPGLVGGHCIGVDPYYLTHKAQEIGYEPKIILAGRKLNDSMAYYVADNLLEAMRKKEISLKNAKVLIMGVTFKENCPDLRNTKVLDMISVLVEHGIDVQVFDPWVNEDEAKKHKINLIEYPEAMQFDAVVLAVAHQTFKEMKAEDIRQFTTHNGLIYDLKSVIPSEADLRL